MHAGLHRVSRWDEDANLPGLDMLLWDAGYRGDVLRGGGRKIEKYWRKGRENCADRTRIKFELHEDTLADKRTTVKYPSLRFI